MKYKQTIVPVLVFSLGLVAGYQPALGQEPSGSKQEKSASGQTGSKVSQSDMRKVEEALKAKGYDPGAVDGKVDKQTNAAIREFQEKNKLQATGDMDQPTAEALGVIIVIAE
jgi:peptidoglycan hydrolase-like protein with peptidoglycan-binding domain